MARKGNGYTRVAVLKKRGGSNSKPQNTPTYATYRPAGADYSPGNSNDVKVNLNLLGRVIR